MPQEKARVQIAGGEPLLSAHLFFVLDLIHRAGFQSRLMTNGSLIDGRMARGIRDHGCRIVQISIDGDEKAHDTLRGHGHFRQAIEGARLLRECGVQVTFSMTLTQDNHATVGSVFQLAQRESDRVSFHRLVPCGRGAELKERLLSKEEIQSLFGEIWKQKGLSDGVEVPLRDPLWKPFLRHLCLEPHVDGCSIGYGGICVDSNGDVYPCRRLPIILGNALSDELTEIWHSVPLSQMRDRNRLKGRCGGCGLRWKCGGCRAIAWATSGDPLAEDPQCFLQLSAGERLGFKLVNWMNQKAYADCSSGGG